MATSWRRLLDHGRMTRPGAAKPALVAAFATAEPDVTDAAGRRADVAARLRRACASMTPEQFARVVDAIVARQLRWARQDRLQQPG